MDTEDRVLKIQQIKQEIKDLAKAKASINIREKILKRDLDTLTNNLVNELAKGVKTK